MPSRSWLMAATALAGCLSVPVLAQDAGGLPVPVAQQPAAPPPLSPEEELRQLQAAKADMQQRMGDFDARIRALEERLRGPSTAAETGAIAIQQAPPPGPEAQVEQAMVEPSEKGMAGILERRERSGTYDPKAGFVLVDDKLGRLNFSFTTYARYLNQNALDSTYVDSFGRTLDIDLRNEVQLNKASMNFNGYLIDPKFQYLLFIWTNNANQGEGAQLALAGFMRYNLDKRFVVSAGIMPLPTTRSTNYSFPNWLRHDNRVMADEFFRGSYTSGIDVFGEIAEGLKYRVMIGNNLSTLGVSSKELDNKFDSVAAAVVWMPTTGEFGRGSGFGDYDYHQEVATLIGAHVTHSTETAQGQPSESDFENAQIRLTDGTLLFSPDPFGTGGQVEEARYRMASLDMGVKYKGFSLEGQWYWRKVDNLKTIGSIPINGLKDNGVALQASAMPIKDLLQAYVTASKIWGANSDPTEFAVGLNVYPFRRREMHLNFEALKLDRSPVGGYHMPIPVGGKGWAYLSDWVIMF